MHPRAAKSSSSLRFDDPNASGSWKPLQQFDEYVLVRLLGQGSMGRVYLARDTVLDRPVAVKFIGNVAPDADDRERFLVEARAVARLQHPNVVTIYRVGELEGHPYLITEYIAGKSLSELGLPVQWRKVLELGVGLARGLAAAHRHGVLHRDIKLANVVLSDTGEVKLLDFSLAKLLDPTAADRATKPPSADEAVRAATSAIERHNSRSGESGEVMRRQWAPSASGRSQREVIPPMMSDSTLPMIAGSSSMIGMSLTQAGTLLGTPHYMAPELWRTESATRRSDVYALGALMYILTTGRPPTDAESTIDLATRVQEHEPRPLLERAPRCDPRLAAIIDRCVRRDPFERYASGEDLLAALESLQPLGRELAIPEGNPYRGLQAFESKHRALFFGRAAEIRAVLARLRADALVVVAGDSGVGKSSLCRAGVAPQVEEGHIDPARQWASATMTPGRYPRQTLVTTMATLFDMSEETMSALIDSGPEEFARGLRKQLGEARGRLLVIDQFEEMATLASAEEVAVVGPLLARVASGLPGLRVLATVRGDFLTRVAQLPGIGDELARAIYFLRPLSREGAREAIVGPARVKGVSFESEALVGELVEAGSQGSLPLLQFALAELWEIRDQNANVITSGELKKIGGVTGALARHADGALAQLLPAQRRAGRRVLMRLVTIEETRASLIEEEIVAGEPAAKTALGALIHARLVVVREVGDRVVYEIAHEALLAGWSTLRGWLDEERETRAVRHRLELAVVDWERLGQHSDGLWTVAQLKEARLLDAETLRPSEREFLAASQAAMARGKALRRAVLASLPIIALLVYAGVWLHARQEREATIDGYVQATEQARAQGQTAEREALAQRTQAFASFDHGDDAAGNATWAAAQALLPEAEQHYARAAQAIETALSYDPVREDLRARLADVLYDRALLAERMRQPMQVDERLTRLGLYDRDGARRARWGAAGTLRLTSDPPGATVQVERYEADAQGRRVARAQPGFTAGEAISLVPGSYRMTLSLTGHVTVHYPLMIERAADEAIEVHMPRSEVVPPGFVYVPRGRFLYGSAQEDELRMQFFSAQPLHSVETKPYLIATYETTYAEYLLFLDSMAPALRGQYLPMGLTLGRGNELVQREDGRWQLTLQSGTERYTAIAGELLRYQRRARRELVDWTKMPVSGIDFGDADGYLAWLDRSGRLPGARLCSEREWERAARGADDREYAHGDRLAPDDANFDLTYGRELAAMGPDAVGSYPQSQSPFGVHDTAGNVFELTVSDFDPGQRVARGGGFFFDKVTSRVVNRQVIDEGWRDSASGLRVCASYPTRP
jgi:serine/threonine protein kinase/formylglycine-generating enzyme required for sulfatase activity